LRSYKNYEEEEKIMETEKVELKSKPIKPEKLKF